MQIVHPLEQGLLLLELVVVVDQVVVGDQVVVVGDPLQVGLVHLLHYHLQW